MAKAPDGDNKKGYCLYCKSYLTAQKKILLEHADTEKHQRSIRIDNSLVNIPKIETFVKPVLTEKRKIAELRLAFYTAEHTSIRAIDHLSYVVKNLDKESPVLKDIHMQRSKCAALIKNNLSPCIVQELLEDIGESFFSLIVDESTAVDCKKLLCLVIRYFSTKKAEVVTTFYRLIEMQSGTSDAIADAIINQIKRDGLNIKHLLGLGVDGASVNVGVNHSLSTILHELNPQIVVNKCICHSLHLAAENACEVLPRHLD